MLLAFVLLPAGGGLGGDMSGEPEPDRLLQEVVLEGQSHLDPMFATVNTPQLHNNQVVGNFLTFVFDNVE